MLRNSIVVLILIPLFVSCASSNGPSSQQMAEKRWSDARAVVLIGLARDQYSNGNFEKSRATLDEALRLAPDNVAAHVLSAKLYIEAGQLEAAERELDSARRCDPANAEADYLSGVVYQRWQQPQQALEFYQQACEKAPAELAYIIANAEMLVSMDRLDPALAMLQAKVTYFEHSSVIRDEVGLLLIQKAQYPQAVEMLRRASILASDDLTVKEHLAMALFYDHQYNESAQLISELVTKDSFNRRADLLMTLGQCQLQLNQLGQAAANLESAAQIMPGSAGVWLELARAQMQLGNLHRADYALGRSLAVDGNSGQGWLLLGYLRIRQSRLHDAYDAFTRASRIDPSDSLSLCMVGLTLDKLGRPADAATYYRQALKINPRDEMAAQLMARLDLNE